MKKRLLFLGFCFHQKTGSADFMVKLLSEHFEITVCLADLYTDNSYADLAEHAGEYDVLVCWQVMPPAHIIDAHLKYRHGVLFPMADACPTISKVEKWHPYRHFQIICFSKQLCSTLQRAGFCASHFQYFPPPGTFEDWGDPESAFFWFRRNDINGEMVAEMLEHLHVSKLDIVNEPDPGMTLRKPSPQSPLELNCHNWFDDKEGLTTKICESAIYVAPRSKEGIGMSFLEAMALGRCVIAPDSTTMNEYINHGVNGILYDPSKSAPISGHDIRKLQENAFESVLTGRKRWLDSCDDLINTMTETPVTSSLRITLRMAVRMFKNPLKTTKALLGLPQ